MRIDRWVAGACYLGLVLAAVRWEPKHRILTIVKWWAVIVSGLMLWVFVNG